MKVIRLKPIDQKTDYMEDLAIKNNTTVSTCGYITCALIQYFAQFGDGQFKGEPCIKSINSKMLTPYIQKAMQSIKKHRIQQVKKYYTQMNQSQRKNYLKDWVATYQIVDYLSSISEKCLNKQVYFFRQCAFDHPQALNNLKWQQKQRVQEQQNFKGDKIFYTSLAEGNKAKFQFIKDIQSANVSQPILIATDVLGHFNVTLLFQGTVYIIDSLSDKQNNYDQQIVEFIINSYKTSYLKK